MISKIFITPIDLFQSLSSWKENGQCAGTFVCHPDWAGEDPLLYVKSSDESELFVFSGEPVVLCTQRGFIQRGFIQRGQMKNIPEKLLRDIERDIERVPFLTCGDFRDG